MKTKSHLAVVICLMVSVFVSCDKDCIGSNGINGEWIWTKSEGGIGGWTLTPATEGKSKHLIIDDYYFTKFEEDSIVFKSQYDLIIEPDTFFGTNRYIKFEVGGELALKISDNDLELLEMCDDCFFHSYKRK